MNEASPRLWFLGLLETRGSIRAGFATALVLWSLGAVVAFAAGGVSPIGLYFVVIFPLYIGYNLAFAPVVLARLTHAVHELEGIDRFSIPLQIAATAVGVAMHELMVTLTPAAPEGAFPALYWLVRFESLSMWILTLSISIIFLRAIGRLRHLGRLARPNLLEATPLAPFGRAGAMLALYFGGIVAILTLVRSALRVGGWERVHMGQAPVVSTVLFTLLLVAAVYFPLSGARLAIRAAKRADSNRRKDRAPWRSARRAGQARTRDRSDGIPGTDPGRSRVAVCGGHGSTCNPVHRTSVSLLDRGGVGRTRVGSPDLIGWSRGVNVSSVDATGTHALFGFRFEAVHSTPIDAMQLTAGVR